MKVKFLDTNGSLILHKGLSFNSYNEGCKFFSKIHNEVLDSFAREKGVIIVSARHKIIENKDYEYVVDYLGKK